MAAIFPSRSRAAEFKTDLPVAAFAGVTRPQMTAIPCVRGGYFLCGLTVAFDEPGALDKVARRIAAHAQLGK